MFKLRKKDKVTKPAKSSSPKLSASSKLTSQAPTMVAAKKTGRSTAGSSKAHASGGKTFSKKAAQKKKTASKTKATAKKSSAAGKKAAASKKRQATKKSVPKKTASSKASAKSKPPTKAKPSAKTAASKKAKAPFTKKKTAAKKKKPVVKKGTTSRLKTKTKPKASKKPKTSAKPKSTSPMKKKKTASKTTAKPKTIKRKITTKPKTAAKKSALKKPVAELKKKVPVRPPFTAYKGIRPYIFTSYAHRNMKDVFQIIKRLNRDRYRIWYDEGIEPGNEWPEIVGSAVVNCSQFLVFMSPYAAESRNVRNEINLAFNEHKDILVVFLQKTNLSEGMKLQIGTVQFINRFDLTEREFLDKLTRVLSSTLRN
jgi:hypothetical protein